MKNARVMLLCRICHCLQQFNLPKSTLHSFHHIYNLICNFSANCLWFCQFFRPPNTISLVTLIPAYIIGSLEMLQRRLLEMRDIVCHNGCIIDAVIPIADLSYWGYDLSVQDFTVSDSFFEQRIIFFIHKLYLTLSIDRIHGCLHLCSIRLARWFVRFRVQDFNRVCLHF